MSGKGNKYTAPLGAGAKFDTGKAPVYRGFVAYFPRAIEAVSRVSERGSINHGWDTWDTVPGCEWRYTDAQVRHMLSTAKGEVIDSDSGLSHLAHEAWNAMARLELALRKKEQPRSKLTHCEICGEPLQIIERWGNVNGGESFVKLECTGCGFRFDKDVS